MAKWSLDANMDAMLNEIATCNEMVVCSGQPANYAGVAAVALARVTLTAGSSGSYILADDTSGRKITIAQKADIPIDTSGSATHVALMIGQGGSVLKYVTTCTSQYLVDTGTVTVPAWKIGVADPT
jgi:hypothetical protein